MLKLKWEGREDNPMILSHCASLAKASIAATALSSFRLMDFA